MNLSGNIHLLLDAARMEDAMQEARELNPTNASLYRNKKGGDEILPVVAPFLFTFPHSAAFAGFVIDKGWGNSWGLWAESDADFDTLYTHFRQFLMVKTEEGKQLYFRFYDPRVLRIFLPTCDVYQLRDFFGPVNRYIMEDEDPAACIIFSLRKGQLYTEQQEADPVQQILKKHVSISDQTSSFWDHF